MACNSYFLTFWYGIKYSLLDFLLICKHIVFLGKVSEIFGFFRLTRFLVYFFSVTDVAC